MNSYTKGGVLEFSALFRMNALKDSDCCGDRGEFYSGSVLTERRMREIRQALEQQLFLASNQTLKMPPANRKLTDVHVISSMFLNPYMENHGTVGEANYFKLHLTYMIFLFCFC